MPCCMPWGECRSGGECGTEGETERERWMDGWAAEASQRMKKLDKEVVLLLLLRAKAHCSPEMRRLYLPQRQLHRTLSGGQRLGSLG